MKTFLFRILLLLFFVQNIYSEDLAFTSDFRRYNHKYLNYTVLLCKQNLTQADSGKVFKLFVERDQWDYPCLAYIPSHVFVYLFIKFHKPSIVTLVSGNGQMYTHTNQIIIPRLNDAMIYGPFYMPCEKAVVIYRSRGFDESLLFSFSIPTKKFLQSHPDPDTCNPTYQNSQLRRSIGYASAPWIDIKERGLHSIWNTVKEEWNNHRKTAFDPLT